ncbi:hypothetical protein ES332_D12G092800v1 [Gossypium tomentosum]|uniref:Uncharacterized protein n=1 Tax=Gossypium tomentosum TaxID=34277 RepID=A0A5D2I774_GOSTO|nr:hypothetical protein ES332_D12G092800v1 [Gossypium tomentosum]
MFSLHFYYEDVSRQNLLLKPNHANVIEVSGSYEIRVVPKAPYNFIIKNEKLAMEIPRCQKKYIHKGTKGYVSDLARQSTLQGHGMFNFSVRITIHFEHIRGFNVTIVTSANTQYETLPPWSDFLQWE